ncbi:MAG: hypothetical protein A2W80_05645 [Candidatus Riflebacteria bacterium GWC2_50_8]|nr:MAG: hypothetical protein A2W80_05645 [Candidatus Riflebacteria bacterium GWC2_50_8]
MTMLLLVIIVFLVLLALFCLMGSDRETSHEEALQTREKIVARTGSSDDLQRLQAMVHAAVIDDITDEIAYSADPVKTRSMLSDRLWQSISDQEEKIDFAISEDQREELRRNLLDEMLGFGPIQRFLDDNSVSEIIVSGPDEIAISRNGQTEMTGIKFKNADHLRQIVERMTSAFDLHLSRQNPTVSLRLPDGSETTITLSPPPESLPTLKIKK